MAYIIYILLYPLIFILSRLPFWLLYGFSDILYIIIYHLTGYRKKIVRRNLQLVFPDKTAKERLQIEKAFYKHFSDLFVEMIKAFHMPLKQMQKRFVFNNPELLNKLTEQGKHIVVVGGHYGNWEWIFSLAPLVKASPIATYLKINNPYFERFMLKNRSRFGGELIETKQLRKTLENYKNSGEKFLLGLLADQSPQRHRAKYWHRFLGVDNVPVFTGPEDLAKKYNAAYVFMKINKKSRGYYNINFELITDNPGNFKNYELTDLFATKLEQQIKANPAYYLWTHNRFKHKDKQPKKQN